MIKCDRRLFDVTKSNQFDTFLHYLSIFSLLGSFYTSYSRQHNEFNIGCWSIVWNILLDRLNSTRVLYSIHTTTCYLYFTFNTLPCVSFNLHSIIHYVFPLFCIHYTATCFIYFAFNTLQRISFILHSIPCLCCSLLPTFLFC